jgi:predicted RNA polymerase sigma factor
MQVDAIAARGELTGSHLLPSVRGELLARLGRPEDARSALLEAVPPCGNAAERAALSRRVNGLS